MNIVCENEGQLFAVLSKLEMEFPKVRWCADGKRPMTFNLHYPIRLLVSDDGSVLVDEYYDDSEDYIGMRSAEEYLHDTMKDDPVNRPSHYTSGKVECIDAMIEAFGTEAVKHFCLCNAFKYHWRHDMKNGQEDINKATWYMNKYRELVNR